MRLLVVVGHIVPRGQRSHVQGRFDQGWSISNRNLPGDSELPKSTALDEVSRVVGLIRVNGEDLSCRWHPWWTSGSWGACTKSPGIFLVWCLEKTLQGFGCKSPVGHDQGLPEGSSARCRRRQRQSVEDNLLESVEESSEPRYWAWAWMGNPQRYDGPSAAIFLSSLAGRKFPASANRPGICFTISFQFGDHRWTGLRQEVQLLLLCPNTYVDSRALSPEWARTGRSFRWLGSISKDRKAWERTRPCPRSGKLLLRKQSAMCRCWI